jgi:nitrite reductase/ring-hydroxylating ferredoxin subunit
MNKTPASPNSCSSCPAIRTSEVRVSGYGKIAMVPKEDEQLARVGAGTPMGELLRRYWQPVCLSAELSDLPKRLRILGEDLVAFRDRSGRVGVLDLHCAHRGASLEYGRIEEAGIRCCYHGWLFAADGQCLQQPGEPPTSEYKDEVTQPAYPVTEYGGLVFAYMGPPDKQPTFPLYDGLEQEGTVLTAYRNTSRGVVAECNWLQIQENVMDPVHTAFLHSSISSLHFTDAYAAIPELQFEETEMGMKYIRTSKQPNGRTFKRVQEIFMPNVRAVSEALVSNEPHVDQARVIGWWVPVDDTHTIGFHLEALLVADGKPVPSALATAPVGRTSGTTPGRTCYEDTQREPDDCEAQVSQRPIAVHALEHKATTDFGIVMYRKLLRNGLRALDQGREPKGILGDPAKQRIKVVAGNEIAAAKDE